MCIDQRPNPNFSIRRNMETWEPGRRVEKEWGFFILNHIGLIPFSTTEKWTSMPRRLSPMKDFPSRPMQHWCSPAHPMANSNSRHESQRQSSVPRIPHMSREPCEHLRTPPSLSGPAPSPLQLETTEATSVSRDTHARALKRKFSLWLSGPKSCPARVRCPSSAPHGPSKRSVGPQLLPKQSVAVVKGRLWIPGILVGASSSSTC